MATKETFVKIAKKKKSTLSLSDLETRKSRFEFITDKGILSAEDYLNLVLFTPSNQSNLGEKISCRLEKHIEELVKEITTALGVKSIYLFSSYESKNKKDDLSGTVKNDSGSLLYLYCGNSFLESLYSSIRNALAHGNVVKKGQYVCLYALSPKEGKETQDKDRKLSFFLKVRSFRGLSAYTEAFRKYN